MKLVPSLPSMGTQPTPSTSSPSSPSIQQQKYEVFLSFRGEDTRYDFTDCLFANLKRRRISVFRDEEGLPRGEEIIPALELAIKQSQYAIIIISPRFIESKACLFELTVIMERWQMKSLTVLPVFYRMDPSNIGKLTKDFEHHFIKLEDDPEAAKEKWEYWKSILGELCDCSTDSELDKDLPQSCGRALKKVSDISAWVVREKSHISPIIDEICQTLQDRLRRKSPYMFKSLVGIEPSKSKIMQLLDLEEKNEVRIIGICGMAGIGKTVLAEVIYAEVSSQYEFEARHFIRLIRETTNNGLVSLQKQFVYNIVSKEEADSLKDDFEVAQVLQNKLSTRKAFIVVDNVNHEEQAEALEQIRAWLSEGSRIILTSKDRHLLNLSGANANIYTVKVLEGDDALKLFSYKAFKESYPEKHFEKLALDFVEYAGGLPLALSILGSFLYSRPLSEWKDYRAKLEEHPHEKIFGILGISLEGLDNMQKDLFLDIACFFNGFPKDSVVPILKGFGFRLIDLKVLEEKSLLNISREGELLLHDLLAKMGQDLESRGDPIGRRRLWRSKDLIHVLSHKTGSDTIEAIALRSPRGEKLCFDAFSNMKNLRMLLISGRPFHEHSNVHWKGNRLKFKLTNNLCVLEWYRFPFSSLPSNFQPHNLIELKLLESSIKRLWIGCQRFDALKRIDLSHSKKLIQSPDFQGIPNLEILVLQGCVSLTMINTSIKFLKRLRQLNLHGCFKIGSNSKLLGDCLSGFSSLEILDLGFCGLLGGAFPTSASGLCSLKSLLLPINGFTRIPDGVWQLSSLEVLSLRGCLILDPRKLQLRHKMNRNYITRDCEEVPNFDLNEFTRLQAARLPLTGLRSLVDLDLGALNLLDGAIPDDISFLSSLRRLDLSGNNFTAISSSIYQLSYLRELILNDLGNLKALPKLPMSLVRMELRKCLSLKMSYISPVTWNSNGILHPIDCSVMVGSIDSEDRAFKILHLHPQSLVWREPREVRFEVPVACGPLLGAGVPDNKKSTSFFRRVKNPINLCLDNDLEDWSGYALLIVYHIDDNLTFPIFGCQLVVNGSHKEIPLIFCVPRLPSSGENGVWVYIPALRFGNQFKNLDNYGNLSASLTIYGLNVEVRETWTRLVRKQEMLEFCDVLSSINADIVNSESLQKFFCGLKPLSCLGPIKAENAASVTSSGSALHPEIFFSVVLFCLFLVFVIFLLVPFSEEDQSKLTTQNFDRPFWLTEGERGAHPPFLRLGGENVTDGFSCIGKEQK